MKILAVQKAFPKHRYDQQQLLEAFARHWAGALHNPRRLEQLFSNVSVGGRCLALPIERYRDLEGFTASNTAYIEAAVELGGQALKGVCEQLDVPPEELSQLIFVTTTGLATPSIDALLTNRLRLASGLRRTPIFGLGCMAGAGGLARMADLLRANPDQLGVLLSVELCSLTLQRQDLSMANLISSGLFGDGAAAVLMAGDRHPLASSRPGPRLVASRSVLYPDSEGVMGWQIGGEGFRVVLSAEVPQMVREHVRRDVEGFLADHGLSLTEIQHVIAHPGGPKVLEAMQEVLGLDDEALRLSWRSLREVGNLSSASVLCILDDTLHESHPSPGDHGLLLAMGPGFCSELVLLRW